MILFYKLLFTVLFLFSITYSYAQDTLTYFNRSWEKVCCKDSAIFYRTGINEHGVYRDSIKDYYMTGELLREGFYPKWGGMGEFTGYFKNGQKCFTATLMNNEFKMTSTWDTTGIKTYKRGSGLSTEYYFNNRKVYAQGNYKAGLKEGLWTWYNMEGKKIAEGIYGKEETFISYNAWDDAGERQLISNGNGSKARYFSNGKLHYAEEWKNNKRDGKYIYYHENGNIRCEGVLKNDKKDGSWKWYYNNGVCEEESAYLEGVLHGPVVIRSSKGNITCKGEFRYGNRRGQWEWFTEDGLPKGTFNYN